MSKVEEFIVDTRPSKEVVVDSLIRDITIEACIFDLIDNSIDAARETIYKLDKKLSTDKPPASYEKFNISITLNGENFSINDNCGGITKAHLASSVLRFGQRSSHFSGIGVFGVGLNRAIFKIGNLINLDSDTGLERCTLELDTEKYIRTDSWELPALRLASNKNIGTTINIKGLTSETSRKFSDTTWKQDLAREIGRRYGKLIEKGLTIKIDDIVIESKLIPLRTNSTYGLDTKFFKLSEDISVYIEAGQHSNHKFSAEPGYSIERNKPLTPEYGWTIFCNERAVIISDQTFKTGWGGKFHTQFYGFIGNVYFSCPNPEKLPWSTTKTDVDLNNQAYQLTLEEMKKFSSKWKSYSEIVKDIRHKGGQLTTPNSTSISPPAPQSPATGTKAPLASAPAASAPTKPTPGKPTVHRLDHNSFETILPDNINTYHCNDKHLALVNEAKRLNLSTLSYTGLVLIRVLFEVSAFWYLTRKGAYSPLRQQLIEEKNDARKKLGKPPLTKTEEKNISPKLDEVIRYFETNDSIWDDAIRKNIKISLKKFAQHKEKLNSAAHNPFQTITKYEAFQIREEVLPILRYLIEPE